MTQLHSPAPEEACANGARSTPSRTPTPWVSSRLEARGPRLQGDRGTSNAKDRRRVLAHRRPAPGPSWPCSGARSTGHGWARRACSKAVVCRWIERTSRCFALDPCIVQSVHFRRMRTGQSASGFVGSSHEQGGPRHRTRCQCQRLLRDLKRLLISGARLSLGSRRSESQRSESVHSWGSRVHKVTRLEIAFGGHV